MANIYINPDWTGVESGTIEEPFSTFPTPSSNNNYYLKSGTTLNLDSIITFSALTNILIDKYDGEDKPIITDIATSTDAGDWTNTSGDIWDFSSATYPLSLQGLNNLGDRNNTSWVHRVNYYGGATGSGTFTEFGQWDSDATRFTIYSDVNPVTKWGTIYYNPVYYLRIRNGTTNMTIQNIRFKNMSSTVRIPGSTGNTDNIIIQHCEFEHSMRGPQCLPQSGTILSNIKIRYNKFYRIGVVGINNGTSVTLYGSGNEIHDNEIYDTGYVEGVGGIYGQFGTNSSNVLMKIYNNIVDNVIEGIYWSSEARCLYFEHDSANVRAFKNTLSRAGTNQAGLHINGGASNVKCYGNLIYNCDRGFGNSDAFPTGTDEFEICNNTFLNCDIGARYVRGTITDMATTLKNNVFYNASGGTVVLRIDGDVNGHSGSIDIDYNLYDGYDTLYENIDGTFTLTVGENNIDGAYIEQNGYPLIDSDSVDTGTKWWTGPNPSGYNGEPFSDFDTDIGANQSTYSPFHPKNL